MTIEDILADITNAIEKINNDKSHIVEQIELANKELTSLADSDKEKRKVIADSNLKLEDSIKSIDKKIEELHANSIKIIRDEIAKVDVSLILKDEVYAYLDAIPRAKDGKDAVIDYDLVKEHITKKIDEFPVPPAEKVNYEFIKEEIKRLVALIPIPKDGAKGEKGDKGDDGVGIDTIKDDKHYFTIKLTNDKEYRVKKLSNYGVGGGIANIIDDTKLQERSELEGEFNVAKATAYKELTYIGNNIDKLEIWETSENLTKLFTKQINYTGSNITQTILTNNQNDKILTRDIVYNGSNIATITDTIT